MTIAFVLGNGVSRAKIDPNDLRPWGKIYGCNALYRTFIPDILVATDSPITARILESGYAKSNQFYTRTPPPDSGAHMLPATYRGYSSGPNAVGLACLSGAQRVFLLGFDLGPTLDNQFNNMYADTEFYKTSQHAPTFAGNWIQQLTKIALDFTTTEFIRICGPSTARPVELDQINNLVHLDIATFVNRINNTKDLIDGHL